MSLLLILLSMLMTFFYARYQCYHKDLSQATHYGMDHVEEALPQSRCSHLWFYWFIYALRAQSLIMLGFGFIEIKLEQQTLLDIVIQTLNGCLLFGLSFVILRGNMYVWFLATILTFNPFFWIGNTLYYFNNKRLFQY